MEKNSFLLKNQHGFKNGRFCFSKLLKHYDRLLENLAADKNVDVVFIDFSKAFGKVDYGILLHKFMTLRIKGKLGILPYHFLTDEVQVSTVEGHKSTEARVIRGVSQGSVLGSLVFLIHINEGIRNSVISSFADDTTVSHTTTSVQGVVHLQDDLKKLHAWAATNNMSFTKNKFEILRYCLDQPINIYVSLLTEGRQQVFGQPQVKCLEIHPSDNGSSSHHITETVKNTKAMADWVLKTFTSREPKVMITLWKALVQATLEYCSQLWSPYKKGAV